MKIGSLALISALAMLAGCLEQKNDVPAKPGVKAEDQYHLCQTNSYQQALEFCKEGQLVSVLPNRWGNEQFPLLMASVICNFDHNIVHTNGGVVCIFTKKRYENIVAGQAKQAEEEQKEEPKK